MNRKAQAILEAALFVGLMLMVLLAAVNYRRNLYEQKLIDINVFDQTKNRAYNNKFTEKDIDGETWECSGATVSYSLTMDRQARRLYQGGQRRSTGSAASVYWSNAEDPEDLTYNYVNNNQITIPEKKLYYDRPGTEDPEDGMKLSTADYIAIAYPMVSSLVQGLFNLKQYGWWKSWGGYLDFAIRMGCFVYFAVRYYQALAEIDKSEQERLDLAKLDEQMGEWGWRVADIVHDGKDIAGKKYVKKVTAQVWDTQVNETKSINYSENQQAAAGRHVSNRSVGVGHNALHTIWLRYDVTVPDPTVEQPHQYERVGPMTASVDLSGGGSETWSSQ